MHTFSTFMHNEKEKAIVKHSYKLSEMNYAYYKRKYLHTENRNTQGNIHEFTHTHTHTHTHIYIYVYKYIWFNIIW